MFLPGGDSWNSKLATSLVNLACSRRWGPGRSWPRLLCAGWHCERARRWSSCNRGPMRHVSMRGFFHIELLKTSIHVDTQMLESPPEVPPRLKPTGLAALTPDAAFCSSPIALLIAGLKC